MLKRLLLGALVCVNLVLLTALVFASYQPPTAFAQEGLSGDYVVVSGEIQSNFDGLFVLDLKTRKLHAFYYERAGRELAYGGFRDLDLDFRNRE